MVGWKKICCPVDFADPSRAAMEQAATLASQFKGDLVLVHVLPSSTGVSEGELVAPQAFPDVVSKRSTELLARWCSDAEDLAGCPTRSVLLCGDAASEIVQHAIREGYDLLVLGTHGRTGIARLFLGSVAERVARRAPCPVLFVRHHPLRETRNDEEEFALYR